MERRRRQTREKVAWTSKMTEDLLQCKKDAQEAVKGSNPPMKSNGKKMGYMQYMHKLWETKGYGHFGFDAQNLSDKANQVERKRKQTLDAISHTILQDVNNVNSNIVSEITNNYTVNELIVIDLDMVKAVNYSFRACV